MARVNHVYTVKYRGFGDEKFVDVLASSKEEAWDVATYEKIPDIEGKLPYSAWVSSVTYDNGRTRYFNTSEGLPY